MTTRTDAEKAQDYTAMGHSVALIKRLSQGQKWQMSLLKNVKPV